MEASDMMNLSGIEAPIQLSDLRLEFPTYGGAVKAIDGVSITVGKGEIVGLVGESGSGKSVTAMSIIRLLPPDSQRIVGGSISVLGRDMLQLSEGELQSVRGDDVAMVFQEPMNALNPTMRIGDQLRQVIRRHQKVSEAEATARALELLRDMRIGDPDRVLRNYPFELSGGMRQRILLAMAFSCRPDVLIADEPTTALDVTIQAQVLALMQQKARETGSSVLFITHDMAVVAQLCDRVYVMYAGQVVEQGTTEEVLYTPQHPYTQALLRSLPELAEPQQPLPTIQGLVPNLIDPPAGCRFRERCHFAHQRCHEMPEMLAADGTGRAARCWLLDPTNPEREAALEQGRQAQRPDPLPRAELQSGGTLLEIQNLEVRFPVGADWRGRPKAFVHALNGVDLELRRGETLAIVGESGCGKSTLGQSIMGVLTPTAGKVVFSGKDLHNLPPQQMRELRRRFQVVFQDPQSSLNPRMPVWKAITEPLLVAEKLPARARRERASELGRQVGLNPDHLERYPHEFSGGQRQRIAIARALALQPDLLVLDEPTSALDVSVQAQILNLLLRLKRELGLTYLFITHDVSVVRHVADRVAVMYLGQVVELGSAPEIIEAPQHPYTRTLLRSVPELSRRRELAPADLQGELPNNTRLPDTCFFRDRCRYAASGCEQLQSLTTASDGRLVRCHRHALLPPWSVEQSSDASHEERPAGSAAGR